MRLSPDAILLGLRLMDRGALSGVALAGHLRAAASGGVPDQLVALEERLLSARPELADAVAAAGGEPPCVPVVCEGCGVRLRARPADLRAAAECPLCGESLMGAHRLLFLGGHGLGGLRAAESPAPYDGRASGRRFAHFELVRILGRGGAGSVYEARNLRAGRTVALKLLEFQPLESAASTMRRLKREARAATCVAHENVVPVLDLGVAEGLSYIEMELVPGLSLRERILRQGALGPQEACRLCIETLSGLSAVHDQKLVHRDVKPNNILIDPTGRARLTDFGVATFLEETTSLTASDKVVGSPHFMAPEQWRGEAVSVRTDIYAMGLVLYHVLTGRLPYEGENTVALMYKHLHEPVLDAEDPPQSVPPRLARIIARATRKEPVERYATTREFAEDLADFAPTEPAET